MSFKITQKFKNQLPKCEVHTLQSHTIINFPYTKFTHHNHNPCHGLIEHWSDKFKKSITHMPRKYSKHSHSSIFIYESQAQFQGFNHAPPFRLLIFWSYIGCFQMDHRSLVVTSGHNSLFSAFSNPYISLLEINEEQFLGFRYLLNEWRFL